MQHFFLKFLQASLYYCALKDSLLTSFFHARVEHFVSPFHCTFLAYSIINSLNAQPNNHFILHVIHDQTIIVLGWPSTNPEYCLDVHDPHVDCQQAWHAYPPDYRMILLKPMWLVLGTHSWGLNTVDEGNVYKVVVNITTSVMSDVTLH